jgi:nucleoside-diphosphate-sugar epimerase
MRLLIIGGTEFLGRHLSEQALARGHRLTLFHRGLTGADLFPDAERILGDRDGGLGALAGREWDAVIDTCGYVPRVVEASAAALAGAVGHYTFVSTLSAFAEDAPPGIDEDDPVLAPPSPGVEEVTGETYGPLKVACERAVERIVPGRSLVLRPGLIVGPHDPTDRFTYWVRRVAAGGEVLAPAPPGYPIQFIDAGDLAAFALDLAERNVTGVFHTVGPDRLMTLGELLESCREVSGSGAELVWTDEEFLLAEGVEGWSDLPLWVGSTHPGFHAFDVSRAIEAGLGFRPVYETLRETLEWDAGRPQMWPMGAGLTLERERELLEAYRARARP